MVVRTQILRRRVGWGAPSEGQGRRGRHELAQSSAPAGEVLVPWLLCALVGLGLALFVGYSVSGYSARYAQSGTTFVVGSARLVELTVIREDRENLACASDVETSELRCGYRQDHALRTPVDESNRLRPYNTIGSELLLGAGLWDSKGLPATLPERRFTVTCNYHVTSVLKSAALRWAVGGKFEPLTQSIPVGTLKDCVIPR
jgi:hypothetical protein